MTKIAILGFGTIGQGLAEVIATNEKKIAEQCGGLEIKYILDLRDFPDHPLADRVVHDYDVIVNDPEVKVVVEMMGGSHPAYDFSLAALKAGKAVVTSNKEVVANFGPDLLAAAKEAGVRYLFEASVGGGIPIIRAMTESLAGNEVCEINGILNGTTNYILTQMEQKGQSMEEALADAQKLGYAEANPTADVDGFDACRKICILSALAFGELIPFEKVSTTGIRSITKEDIAQAKKNNSVVKLIARACKLPDGRTSMSVAPTAVRADNPLAGVSDVFNAILVRGNTLGDVMFYGKGAGSLPTASAVLADVIDIVSKWGHQPLQQQWTRSENVTDELPSDVLDAYRERLGTPIIR